MLNDEADFIRVIGRDCEEYGAGLVMLITAREREEEDVISRPNRSTRARIRRKVEMNLVQRKYDAMMREDSNFSERDKVVFAACLQARRTYGPFWLAYALHDYFTEVKPVYNVESHVTNLLDEATNSIKERRQLQVA